LFGPTESAECSRHRPFRLVTERGAGIEIRTDVEKRLKIAAITGFTAGEMEGNWQATEVGLQVNLGRETAARAAQRLIMLPPFAPATETWARTNRVFATPRAMMGQNHSLAICRLLTI
jgi:hypothetical protein